LKQLHSKPYKLYNKIQHYDWGTRNENAFIPNLLSIKVENDLPYAELWIGAHPKASSEIEIDGEKYSLDKVVEKFPYETLGKYVCNKFNRKFPFLLKILSVANALSIQTHPDKIQAKKLHASDSQNYPDDNHKPEIAIAIDSLTAIAGFKPIDKIKKNLKELIELQDFVGCPLIKKILKNNNVKSNEENFKALYSEIMKKSFDTERLTECIESISKRFNKKERLSEEEKQFLKQKHKYGIDVGLLSFFFFNILELKEKQAIFIDAGIPHAYIFGNIVECMANSDNVVRAGLTNKFKDVNTLVEILKYDFKEYKIIDQEQKPDEIVYKTSACEFQITRFEKDNSYSQKVKVEDKFIIYLIMCGTIKLEWKSKGKTSSQAFTKGDAIFIPASLDEFILSSDSSTQFYRVVVPD
jgi:mannose-6-phosphate isomerase